MSYILEALKKAQAERQLGNAPTIHAIPIQPLPAARGASRRLPVIVTLLICAAVLAGAGLLWWRQSAPPPPVVVVQAPPPAPVVLPAPQPYVPPRVAPAPIAAAPVQVPQKVRAVPPPRIDTPPPAAPPEVAPKTAAPAVEAAAPAPPEENLPFMRELPEQQRTGLPQVSFGGYMYSKNPADRLLLIDKVLRHEGEEVAPGLILERLQPKAAVMNYRGLRYRVAY